MTEHRHPLRPLQIAALTLLPLLLLLLAWLAFAFLRQGGVAPFRVPHTPREPPATDAATLARGLYLATLGNCAGCHTARGGAPYAGGHPFATPYGIVYSSNLTPDVETGIGAWSLAEFRHAMRHGISRNGVQSPVFPYANFSRLDDTDIDALFAHLATLPPVQQPRRANAWEFPANLPGAMTAWRLLNHRPAPLPPAPSQSPAWQRGRYLVNGIGHCSICHGARGAFGSLPEGDQLAGGRMADWYAPSLDRDSLARYPRHDLARYLRGGTADTASAYGPMADVVFGNLQYLHADDADAIALYLQSLPAPRPADRRVAPTVPGRPNERGEQLYAEHCADCHGDDGRGEPGVHPPLDGAVAIVAADPVNAINAVMLGAIAPATAGNPRPQSMPPFAQTLPAGDVAAIVNYIRARWGRHAGSVTADNVRAHGSVYR